MPEILTFLPESAGEMGQKSSEIKNKNRDISVDSLETSEIFVETYKNAEMEKIPLDRLLFLEVLQPDVDLCKSSIGFRK